MDTHINNILILLLQVAHIQSIFLKKFFIFMYLIINLTSLKLIFTEIQKITLSIITARR